MATQPLKPSESEEKLPVNVRDLTDKRHAIVRLDQVQRSILKNPDMFHKIDADRSLNHVREETQKLQAALLRHAETKAREEYDKVQQIFLLMQAWSAEDELSDVFLLDQHRYEELQKEINSRETYQEWVEMPEQLIEERERLYQKYAGFFETRMNELQTRRKDTEKKLAPCQPRMEETRQRMEAFKSTQQQINYYAQRSTNALVGGMGALVGLTFVGFVSGIWGGWLIGLFLGYIVFSNIAALYTDLEGKPMEDMYAFLSQHYELKNLKPFFQYDNKEKPEQPTRFDAARGEVLARFMQKDVKAASNEYSRWERQHTEYVGYLQYLEGQRAWSQEQLRKLTLLARPEEELDTETLDPDVDIPEMAVLEAPPEPEKPKTEEFQKIPEPVADTPEVAPTGSQSATKKAARKKSVRKGKVRPAKMPDRAS